MRGKVRIPVGPPGEQRLYRVDFHGSCYVLASSGIEATDIAIEAASSDATGAGIGGSAQRVKPTDKIPSDWLEALPWGDADQELTIAQIIKRQGEE